MSSLDQRFGDAQRGDDQAVGEATVHAADQFGDLVGVAADRGERQPEALAPGDRLHGLDHLDVDRVGDVGHRARDRGGVPQLEQPGGGVGHVAELVDRGAHLFDGGAAGGAAVQRAGDARHGHARQARDLRQRGSCRAHSCRLRPGRHRPDGNVYKTQPRAPRSAQAAGAGTISIAVDKGKRRPSPELPRSWSRLTRSGARSATLVTLVAARLRAGAGGGGEHGGVMLCPSATPPPRRASSSWSASRPPRTPAAPLTPRADIKKRAVVPIRRGVRPCRREHPGGRLRDS